MNHIQGSLKITNLHKITDEAEAKEAMLSCKSSLQKLVLIWKDNVSVAEEVLRGLKPHHQLKELRIVDYSGATFPQWLSHDVTKLQKLELVGCQSCCNLPKIGQLPDLKLLHLKKMSNIRSLDQNFCGVISTSTGCFHSLESLVLHDMTELQEWNGLEDNIMPSLRELKIVNCPKLKSLPFFLYQFTSLVDLQIEECISLSSIPKLPSSLESLTIGNCNLLKNKCQDGGEHWSNIKEIRDVFVDGVKMPTTPAEHISSRNAENHNTSLQGFQYVIQGVVSAFGRLF
ncbi:putative disease resistance RPP13-like protein 1 [Chenopodium quinoa]|uniref:putative disease resistance RPP13-like protein 1 n=1 Tax=Chenopodium quinoa TaxID=63459 RepID=UPI000B76DFB9|nr:putative disease resistance RPP13-like protein 1 [Chenopodium quinoa]